MGGGGGGGVGGGSERSLLPSTVARCGVCVCWIKPGSKWPHQCVSCHTRTRKLTE